MVHADTLRGVNDEAEDPAAGVAGRCWVSVGWALSCVEVVGLRQSRSTVFVNRYSSELIHLDDWSCDGAA